MLVEKLAKRLSTMPLLRGREHAVTTIVILTMLYRMRDRKALYFANERNCRAWNADDLFALLRTGHSGLQELCACLELGLRKYG